VKRDKWKSVNLDKMMESAKAGLDYYETSSGPFRFTQYRVLEFPRVNAHELAHQGWGYQLIGSMTQGSNMMSETLAEYSALNVMEKKYGEENIKKYLK
jgi:ABC-2 type transport system permease protein